MEDTNNPYSEALLYEEQNADFTEDLEQYFALSQRYGQKILELGSGTGRVSRALAERGCTCTGIDISTEMHALAQERAKQSPASSNLSYVCADVRTFDLKEEFDLVIFPFNSICHMRTGEDIRKLCMAVSRVLRKDGVFCLHIFVPQARLLARSPDSLISVAEFWSESRQENIEVLETSHYDAITQIQTLDWYYQGDEDESELTTSRTVLRVYYPQELIEILATNGYVVEEILGDYTLEPAHSTSLALTYICRQVAR